MCQNVFNILSYGMSIGFAPSYSSHCESQYTTDLNNDVLQDVKISLVQLLSYGWIR